MIEIKRRWDTRASWMGNPKLTARVNPNVAHYFPVYTMQEASDLNLTPVYWKHAEEDMQWVSTDDNYVMQALYVKYYTSRGGTSKVVSTTACGKRFASAHTKMLFDEQMAVRQFSANSAIYKIENLLKKKRVQQAILAYANMLLAGKVNIKEVYSVLMSNGGSKWTQKAENIWRFIMKTEEGKRALDAEMQRILAGKGITREWVIDQQLEALQIARDKKDALTMVKIVDSIVKVSGLDKPKQEDNFFIGELNEPAGSDKLIEAGFTEVREVSDADYVLRTEPGGTQGLDEASPGQDEEEAELHTAERSGQEYTDS